MFLRVYCGASFDVPRMTNGMQMSLKNKANGPYRRYSTGPLYSELELYDVEQSLTRDGYVKAEDNKALGMRIYSKDVNGVQTGSATIYLDSLGCDPLNSGTMFISDEKGARGTTVWTMAHEDRCQGTRNPLARLLRKMF